MCRKTYILSIAIAGFLGCQKEANSPQGPADMGVSLDTAMPSSDSMTMQDVGLQTRDGQTGETDGASANTCSADRVTDYMETASPTDDDGFIVQGAYGGRADFVGSCGGEGNEKVYSFTAPTAGPWMFTILSSEAGLDTVLYARTTCSDTESERACNDDMVPGQILLSQLRVSLEVGETIFIYVDAFAGPGAPFELKARLTPIVALGEGCDALGQRVGCPDGAFCRVDLDSDEDEGVCTFNGPPVLGEVLAYQSGNTLSIQIAGSDQGADVTGGRLQLYQGAERIVLDPDRGADTFIMDPIDRVYGQTEFFYRYRASVFDNWPQTTSVRVQLTDNQGNESEWSQVDIRTAAPAVDRCDQHRISDVCPENTACLDSDGDGTFRCSPVTAPTIRTAKGYHDVENRLVGFEVDGIDPDQDVTALRVELLGPEEDTIATGEIDFDQVSHTDDRYSGQLSFRLAESFDFTQIRIQVIDREGLRSEFRLLPALRGPRDVFAGDPCDPIGARSRCESGQFCFASDEDTEPTCGLPPTTCPEPWGQVAEIDTSGVGASWRAQGDLNDFRNHTSGSCGGGSAQAIFSFVAPSAGTYSLAANSTVSGADPLIYARTHCGFDGSYPDFELGCNNDHSRYTRAGIIRVELEDQEQIYVFVDGFRNDDSAWRGPFTLVVRRLP